MMAPQAQAGITLSTLLHGMITVDASQDREVTDIALDSRDVGPGSCFFAVRGSRENGLSYAANAIARGATACVVEDNAAAVTLGVPIFELASLRLSLGEIAKRFFGDPSAALNLFTVTGTNGKSTVAHITAQALNELGQRCAYIGTLGAGSLDGMTPLGITTPDVFSLNRWLARFANERVNYVALETSSHALDQNRIAGLKVAAAAFTNLGHDHLDYHGNTEAYARSKQSLFKHEGLKTAVVNIDDALGADIALSLGSTINLWSCSSGHGNGASRDSARVTAAEIESSAGGIHFTLSAGDAKGRIESCIPGRFNVDNLLLVGAFLLSLGYSIDRICSALSRVRAVPGRMEYCGTSTAGTRVFIDYAHSPDSLLAALSALREFDPRKLIVVFGCGGERDRSKRPKMGEIAATHADQVILTSDNPRGEDNASITQDIVAGMAAPGTVTVEHDRARAVESAVRNAGADDIVLIAGKGHELIQETRGVRHPFSDHAEVRRVLSESRR